MWGVGFACAFRSSSSDISQIVKTSSPRLNGLGLKASSVRQASASIMALRLMLGTRLHHAVLGQARSVARESPHSCSTLAHNLQFFHTCMFETICVFVKPQHPHTFSVSTCLSCAHVHVHVHFPHRRKQPTVALTFYGCVIASVHSRGYRAGFDGLCFLYHSCRCAGSDGATRMHCTAQDKG